MAKNNLGTIITNLAFVILYFTIMLYGLKSTYMITATYAKYQLEGQNTTEKMINNINNYYNRGGSLAWITTRLGIPSFLLMFIAGSMLYYNNETSHPARKRCLINIAGILVGISILFAMSMLWMIEVLLNETIPLV